MNPVIQALSSTEVRWEGTDGGLTPDLIRNQPESIPELSEDVIPHLIDALSDRKLFVVAHVILTQLSGIEYQAFPLWNGLAVDIAADGTVTIDPEQRFDLIRRWERWGQTEPRPRVLPSGD